MADAKVMFEASDEDKDELITIEEVLEYTQP